MSPLFTPFHLPAPNGGVTLPNRMVVAPMCQYSAHEGVANDWHLMHWANLLNSGTGAFIIEATGVTSEGRITEGCLGLWNAACESALTEHLKRARAIAPKAIVGIQLAHAGRKASSHIPSQGGASIPPQEPGGWQTLAPSAVPHLPHEHPPVALDHAGLQTIVQAFADAAQRAQRAGVDFIELHGAHGYLLHQFLSPVANQRTDEYGGSLENRMRFPLAITAAIRAVYNGVLGMRISATDWVADGFTPEEAISFAQALKASQISYIHVSSGGVAAGQKIPIGPGYQLPFAQLVKEKTGLPTIAVGMITDPVQAQAVIADGQADLVAFARAFLYKPRWGWEAAAVLGGQVEAVEQYWRCLPREHQHVFKEIKIGGR